MDQLVFNYRPVPSDCLCSYISCSLTIVVVVVDSSDGRGDSEYIVHKFMALFIKDLFLESTRKPLDAAAVDLRIDSVLLTTTPTVTIEVMLSTTTTTTTTATTVAVKHLLFENQFLEQMVP